MAVAICIEASHQRGAGHLFRAIVLARELMRCGQRVLIVVNGCPQAIERLREEKIEYRVAPVGPGGDWEETLVAENPIEIWINDRLDTDAIHGKQVRSLGLRLVCFDDNGEGALSSDLNVCALAGVGLGSIPGRRVLTGEKWLVLNPGLARFRRLRTACRRLLVTMGGSDTHGVTLRVVRLLRKANRAATVVTGPLFAHRSELESIAAGTTFDLRSGVSDMGKLYREHDLAITGGGITPFEAASTGLPSIIIANEPHEIATARRLEKLGCARFAGNRKAFDEALVLSCPVDVSVMSAAGLNRIPTDGVRRVGREILNG